MRDSEYEAIGCIEALKILSPREIEVLEQVSLCKTNREIGIELGIATTTVKTHRRNICRKLQLKGRYALMKWATGNKGQLL